MMKMMQPGLHFFEEQNPVSIQDELPNNAIKYIYYVRELSFTQ